MNLRGEVIGINTAIASGSGRFDGVGFAIPSNMAQDIDDIVKTGRVIRGFLGAVLKEIGPEKSEEVGTWSRRARCLDRSSLRRWSR